MSIGAINLAVDDIQILSFLAIFNIIEDVYKCLPKLIQSFLPLLAIFSNIFGNP